MIESPRASRPGGTRPSDEEGRIFDDDDSDLTENQEFDQALAEGSEALQSGDAARARTLLEKGLRHKPRNQRARNLLGLSLFKLGELEKAESLYRGLIEDHPADPTLRVNLGLVFLKSGASSDAIRCFETALDLQPDHGKGQNYLGLALAQKGEHAKAREWFNLCGNLAMSDRMTAALQASPIRQVAEAAEQSLSSDQPFSSALDADKAAAPAVAHSKAADERSGVPGDDIAPEAELPQQAEVVEGHLPTPPQVSKWVATAPASATPPSRPISYPPSGDLGAPATRSLGRIPINSKGPGPNDSPDLSPPRPDRNILADAHAAAALAHDGALGSDTDENPPVAVPVQTDEPFAAAPPPGGQPDAALEAEPEVALAGEAAPAATAQTTAGHARPDDRLRAHAPADAPARASEPSPTVALVAYTNSRRLVVPVGEGGFVIGSTELVIQVKGEMLTRLDGLVAGWGTAVMRPELKRFRGKATDKPFGEGARRMLRAAGDGRYVVAREGRCFTALELGDEPAYFREEILFAFEESLVFENGRVPSKSGTDLHLVHLRGRGKLLLVTVGSPRSVEVNRGEPLRIPMDQLVGWHGPLIQPRLVSIVDEAPELGIALELSGEGRALVDAPEGR